MTALEIETCLNSMTILVDTREQPSAKAQKRYESFGCSYTRTKLNYGDYTYNFTLPNGSLAYEGNDIKPLAVIERKMNLEELSGCFCQQRSRFKAEFERARENNASIYLVVENATWEKILNGRYKTKFDKKAYLASITAYMARYNIKPIFCQEELTGKLIKEILYRELKEQLERGAYG